VPAAGSPALGGDLRLRLAALAAGIRCHRPDRLSAISVVGKGWDLRQTSVGRCWIGSAPLASWTGRRDSRRGEQSGQKGGSPNPFVTGGISAANIHDSTMLQPMVESKPAAITCYQLLATRS
jgi:hypothetical protein